MDREEATQGAVGDRSAGSRRANSHGGPGEGEDCQGILRGEDAHVGQT